MAHGAPGPVAVVHLDESCLGNGREGDNPGGAGGLVELRGRRGIERRDIYLSAPATTNNRMALAGAAETLEVLAAKGARLRVLIVSDSEYLVKGMREWAPGWERRGWVRKGGAIENLALWQRLVTASRLHETQLTWVRGHKGHAKNEYANDLAIRAAREQLDSKGAVVSGFLGWLETKRKKKLYLAYDPDESFTALERRVSLGERFPHSDAAAPLR
jgi:ribonuclease HI